MTTTAKREPRRRLDVANLVLLVIGVIFAVVSYCLVTYADTNVLVIAPSIVAITMGATHLVKREVPRG
ncbi:hypothetical protein GS881_15775 [Rhodococcus hoagii]|nr:hypothetical protein [Prescottella equi]